MRKIGISVAVLATSLSVAGVAQAIDVKQGLDIKTTGSKGTAKKPKGLKLTTTTSTTALDGKSDGTFATKSAVIHFDKKLVFNPKSFKTCDAATAFSTNANPDACPSGSLVGTGLAVATVGGFRNPDGTPVILAHPTIKAFNGAGGKLNLVLKQAAGEVNSSAVLTGTLKKDTGKYGQKLVVPIPANPQEQAKLKITLNTFTVTIKNQKAKGKYYVSSTGCGTSGKYSFGGDFVFSDGTSKSVTTTSKC